MSQTPFQPSARARGRGVLAEEPAVVLGTPAFGNPHSEIYHFLLETGWPAFIGLVVALYLLSNLAFALAYLLCGADAIHGAQTGSLTDAYFFSVQTMATIGYGKMTPMGFAANAIVSFEAFFGIVTSALTTGLAFARFTRPTAGVRFSELAVVGLHNGEPALKFRLMNLRRSHIVEAGIRLWLVREAKTLEGESYRRPVELALQRAHSPVFALSWTAIHLIDAHSPFAGATEADVRDGDWHLLVTFSGYHESFANQVYARHVYDSRHLKFGHNFVDMITYGARGQRLVDTHRFNEILPLAPQAPHQSAH